MSRPLSRSKASPALPIRRRWRACRRPTERISMSKARIGVIGGSGLYAMDELTEVEEVRVSTPFGDPSDSITIGTLQGERVAFLPRHARGHRILPSDIPVRANIYALKSLGVQWVIAASA